MEYKITDVTAEYLADLKQRISVALDHAEKISIRTHETADPWESVKLRTIVVIDGLYTLPEGEKFTHLALPTKDNIEQR